MALFSPHKVIISRILWCTGDDMKLTGFMVLFAVIALLMAITVTVQGQSTALVNIKNSAFMPGTVTISKGGTVTWVNQDSAMHSVKFGSEESRPLAKGEKYSRTFNAPGTYEYTCGIHPSMKGKVIVK